jgi:hypothetical protein
MRLNKALLFCLCLTLAWVSPARAQEFRGRINGTVTDNTGAVLPGVTVTASGPALIQPQVQVTGSDGTYRFLALPPGVYAIDFELVGFQNIKREGVRVVINQTLTVDQALNVATLQETVTVTGASPIVDTSTTQVGTNFTKELLTEIPNARDIWAAMSQAPGIQMTGYDVGGSNTGNQTGYRTYGFDTQNQTRLEGIDTTEGTAANAGYFDFGSFEEFQVGGAGADASAFAGGAVLSISVKSGGDRLQGNWYSDLVTENFVSDNVPSYLKTPNTRNEDGYFTANRAGIARGNPVQKQYDLNLNVGGPIWRQKAWFFYSYRLNDQYQYIPGKPDETQRSKLSNRFTAKVTLQASKNNQIILFANQRQKLQDLRGYGPTTPKSAAYYQSSVNTPMKAQWTSVIGSRAFLDVMGAQWLNFFPLEPVREYGLYDGPWGPGRLDAATGNLFDGGSNNGYQDQKRYKPQFYATLSYFQDGWAGTHDFRFGIDAKQDKRVLERPQPFDIFYRDLNAASPYVDLSATTVNQVDIFNSTVTGDNRVTYQSAWINDTWTVNNRLTVNLGLRLERYRDGWPDQEITPNGIPALANWPADVNPTERARYQNFIAPRSVSETTVAQHLTLAPRVGFAYDITGDNRTVAKVYFGQSRWNSADTLADLENPVGLAQLRYAFLPCTATRTTACDLNGNRLLDSPLELGAFNSTQGGAGFVRVDRNLKRPTSNEVSVNLEREVIEALSARASYVYKNMRNVWAEDDTIRGTLYNVPITIIDPGPDNNVATTADNSTIQTFDRPGGVGQDRVFTNPKDNDADFHTVEFALNRRFAGRWMLLSSVGYTWSTMLHDTTGYGRLTNNQNILPARRIFGDNGIETSTTWNYKLVGRYVMPLQIGLSGSWKVQSGQNYGRTLNFTFPGDGLRVFRVEPITANRYPTASILDFRADKSFSFGKIGKLTAQVDVFNALNANVPTDLRATSANFNEVLNILAPRVIRFGLRYDF